MVDALGVLRNQDFYFKTIRVLTVLKERGDRETARGLRAVKRAYVEMNIRLSSVRERKL